MSQATFMVWFKQQFSTIIASEDAAYERALYLHDWREYERAHTNSAYRLAELYNSAAHKGCTKEQLEYIANECDVAGYDISTSFGVCA